uniref:Uncharacterized protein n=1 Tax=Setaria viridis TaxID=4556 RepID=A0A4U6VAT3_SETVI|nr:hypothetical protein SEVIR_3G188701v2 [Setaria viridis]
MAKAASKPARTQSTNTSRPITTCASSSTFRLTSATTTSSSSSLPPPSLAPQALEATTRQHRRGNDPSTWNSPVAPGARRSTRTPSHRLCRLGRWRRTVSTGSPSASSSARSPAAAPPPHSPPRPYVSTRNASAPVRWSYASSPSPGLKSVVFRTVSFRSSPPQCSSPTITTCCCPIPPSPPLLSPASLQPGLRLSVLHAGG